MALQRLQGVKNKMRRLGKTVEYDNAINDNEAALVGPRTWYLPPFGVVNINKPKKMKLVFDVATTINGICLCF